jgi:hypothetical protein
MEALHHKLNLALQRCGMPPLRDPDSYRKVGSGAWHDAYLVTPQTGQPVVIRLRKKIIYGRREVYDEQVLHEDYAPVGVYYQQANRCQPGICPEIYHYRVEPDLIFTLESYMGAATPLAELTEGEAQAYGQTVGQFFRAMHALTPDVAVEGCGLLVWDGQRVVGKERQSIGALWQTEIEGLRQQAERLYTSELIFDRATITSKLDAVLVQRDWGREPLALVNRDVTPENLIVREGRLAGLVDPVPMLHNGTRYAVFFLYCYQFLLPALNGAPRYAHHRFREMAPIMAAVAKGYLEGYTQGDEVLRRAVQMEYFLWLLSEACDDYELAQGEMSEEMRLRTGGNAVLSASVQAALREMERLDLA